MGHWTESLDAIPLDLLSKQDKDKIEALVRLKVIEPDLSLFRGDSGAVSTRLKELLQLQGTGAAIPTCACPAYVMIPEPCMRLWCSDHSPHSEPHMIPSPESHLLKCA